MSVDSDTHDGSLGNGGGFGYGNVEDATAVQGIGNSSLFLLALVQQVVVFFGLFLPRQVLFNGFLAIKDTGLLLIRSYGTS